MATEITDLIQIPFNKKVVIDFYATWCGPCARVTPIIDELAEKFENITFLKVNVDEADEIAAGFEISSLPTFVYLNLGNIVQRIEGANLADILTSIEKLDQIVNVQRTETKIEPRTENITEKKIERREKIQRPVIDSEMKSKKKPEPLVEMKVQPLIEMKIESKSKSKSKESRDIEKKKSKKKSSKESQKKAERRNFNEMNPYEIEYNNDTPQVSSDSEYGSS
jgi:thioredoxin 1